jgi:small subunit ribosomal protein S6
LNTYELAVLYHPDLEIDLEKASQKVAKIIVDNKGTINAEDNWGKRKLAYKIKNNDHAVYVFYNLYLPSPAIKKIEANLNITDEVIRFLITKVDSKAIAKAEAIKNSKKAKKENRAENSDEESIVKSNDSKIEKKTEKKPSVKTKTAKKTSVKKVEE